MSTYKQHLDLANERFDSAENLFDEGKDHTAAHLYINSVINYHNAACQKFLEKIPSHKHHLDTSYFNELSKYIGTDFPEYKQAYKTIMPFKSQADYGIGLSFNATEKIRKRAQKIREIIEPLL
ncbi:MAG: hypothetical protein ABIH20_05095 [Candidatus Diapherotrites archaeon]